MRAALEDIDTDNRDQAAAVFARTFPDITIDDDPEGHPFRFRYHRVDRGALARTRLSIRGVARMSGDYPDHIAIGRRLDGMVRIGYAGDRVDTARPYLRPPGRSEAVFDNSDVELLILDSVAFAKSARKILEGSGLELAAPHPQRTAAVSSSAARLWHATANTLGSELFADGDGPGDVLLEELAVTVALASFRLTGGHRHDDGLGSLPRVVRRATEYIHGHLAEPITVAMVSGAARVSVRTLQAGFRTHLQTTPLGYIRRARLEAARHELQQSTPEAHGVAQIARRWGFTHAGRFSMLYATEYGEHPHETLRR